MAKVRICKNCGKKMSPTCLWLCERCQALGMGAGVKQYRNQWEVLEVAKEHERMGILPIDNMKLEDIAALARCYQSPYNTYGKLRSYVESTKKLPPCQFERSKNENV